MRLKQNLLLLFYLLAGIVVGGMLASLAGRVGFLGWLAYSASIGLNAGTPLVVDLSVVQLTFGFTMSISVAQVITIALAIFLYSRLRIK